MKKYESQNFRARLILGVNRTSSHATSGAIIDSAISLKSELAPYIVGVDFCGDPTKNRFKDFEPIFARARAAGLKVTIHAGEVANYADTDDIISFKPDRFGHCALLSAAQLEKVKSSGIPIESCPSSNLNTLGKYSYSEVPNIKWMKESGYPFSICTDDTILFNNDATAERFEVAHAFGFTAEEILKAETNAAKGIFDDESKEWLAKIIH